MLLDRIESGAAISGVVGLGYVGLPLAAEAAKSGFHVIAFDVDRNVVAKINSGESHIQDVSGEAIQALVGQERFRATAEFSKLETCDAISICVPTPLNKIKDPDLSYVISAARSIRDTLRPGQLVILESTTYPGTTREVILPILEETGLRVGRDFFLCYSPERVDPGNPTWNTRNTPKILGGVTAACAELGIAYYSRIFDTMVPVESAEAAELVKVYENTFRMINIALANELAQACERLGVDVWGVIDAAATPVQLTAPISGMISEVFHEDGAALTAGEPILVIRSEQPEYVVGYLPHPLRLEPRKGMEVVVRTQGSRPRQYEGRIIRVGAQLEDMSAAQHLVTNFIRMALPVQIAVAGDVSLRPGEIVNVMIKGDPDDG